MVVNVTKALNDAKILSVPKTQKSKVHMREIGMK